MHTLYSEFIPINAINAVALSSTLLNIEEYLKIIAVCLLVFINGSKAFKVVKDKYQLKSNDEKK